METEQQKHDANEIKEISAVKPNENDNQLNLNNNPLTIGNLPSAAETATMVSAEKKQVNTVTVKKRKGGGSDINSESNNCSKKKIGRKTKKRRIEEGAPRPPLTGYVRYMNDRREKLKPDYPDKSHIEMTKIIADEWSRLCEEEKTPYLKRAEAERAIYNTAMLEFYKQKRLLGQENKNPAPSNKNGSHGNSKILANGGNKYSQMNGNGGEASMNKCGNKLFSVDNKVNESRFQTYYPEGCIPIFTDEFLDHNKTIDLELRALRKSNIDYEQQNSVLEKHIENMKTGVEKIENENKELAEKNRLMQKYLDKLKAKLVQAFSGIALPGEPNGATLDNIDKYMTDLQGMVSNNSHSVNKAKDIIRKLDLHITL